MRRKRKQARALVDELRAELGPLSGQQRAILNGLEAKLAAVTRAAEEIDRESLSVAAAGAVPLCFERYLKLSDSVRADLLELYRKPPGGMFSDDGAPG